MDNDFKREWTREKDSLMRAIKSLGFPEGLGEAVAKNLGSPKAMNRMTVYLVNVQPKTPEPVVDEMLAILSDIEAWRTKKDSIEANARYNEVLNVGLGNEDFD